MTSHSKACCFSCKRQSKKKKEKKKQEKSCSEEVKMEGYMEGKERKEMKQKVNIICKPAAVSIFSLT